MTDGQILTAVLSSSLLSAGLTSDVNYYLTSINYKNEYYKKLLDKRLDAYQDVYNFLSNLKTYIHDTDDSILTPYILANGIAGLDQTIINILVPMKKSFWLSPELADKLTKLNVLLVELSNIARLESDADKALRVIGYTHIEELRTVRKLIQKQIQIDFQNLDNVKEFINNAHRVL